jgi:hypothetical protein
MLNNFVADAKLKNFSCRLFHRFAESLFSIFRAALNFCGVEGFVELFHKGRDFGLELHQFRFVNNAEQIGEGLRSETIEHSLHKMTLLKSFVIVDFVSVVTSG